MTRPIRAVGLLGSVATSAKVFYPHDFDRLAPTTALSFRLTRPATVTWTIRNAAGTVVATHLVDVALEAGSHAWTWDGRSETDVLLPQGAYTSYVTASDGTFSASQAVRVEMAAFAIATSTAAPRRGRVLTVTVTSAEYLNGSPRLYITQPGFATRAVTLSRVDSRTWRVTTTLKSGGSAGTLRLKVWALDYDGRSQATYRTLPLS